MCLNTVMLGVVVGICVGLMPPKGSKAAKTSSDKKENSDKKGKKQNQEKPDNEPDQNGELPPEGAALLAAHDAQNGVAVRVKSEPSGGEELPAIPQTELQKMLSSLAYSKTKGYPADHEEYMKKTHAEKRNYYWNVWRFNPKMASLSEVQKRFSETSVTKNAEEDWMTPAQIAKLNSMPDTDVEGINAIIADLPVRAHRNVALAKLDRKEYYYKHEHAMMTSEKEGRGSRVLSSTNACGTSRVMSSSRCTNRTAPTLVHL